MRKILLLSIAVLAGLAGLYAVLRPAALPPAMQAGSVQSRPAETLYAPAQVRSAALSQAGNLRLTGIGTPQSAVTLMDGETVIETARLGNDTEWTIEAKLPPARIRRRVVTLTLSARLPDDTVMRSEESLVILTEPVNFAQALLLTRPGGATRIVQSPFGALPSENGLTLEAIDYDDAGGIIVSGNTAKPGRIRLQAGRTVVGETGPDAGGRWSLIAGSILPVGSYRLRLQHVSEDNRVDAQMDVDFTRRPPVQTEVQAPVQEPQDSLSGSPAMLAGDGPSADFDTGIWHLSRPLTGGGHQHTLIYAPAVSASE